MAATKVGAYIPFAKTINGCSFAGRYVCDECLEPCGGVSLSDVGKLSGKRHFKWLCDLCIRVKQRKTRTPEQKQAAIDRLSAARRGRTAAGYSPGAEGSTNTRREEMSTSKPVAAVTAVAVDVNPNKEVYGIM
jgi:hypothetical protein